MSPYVAISRRLLRAKSDAVLVALVGEGSDAAFATIVERHRPALLRHCRSMLGSHQAEDAVQQTFVLALQAIQSGTEVRELRPWLYRIARNVALRELTAKHSSRVELDAEWEDVASSGELERRAEVRAILGEVDALPGRQRAALIRATSGESNAAIAADLGINEAALRQLIYRARSTVRDKLRILFPGPLVWVGTRLEPLAARLPWASDGVTPLLAPAAAVIAGAALVVTPAVLGHHGQPRRHHSARARIEASRAPSIQPVVGSVAPPTVASSTPASAPAAAPVGPRSPAPLSGPGAEPTLPAGWVRPKIVSAASVNQTSGPGWVTPQYVGSGSSSGSGSTSGSGSSSSGSGSSSGGSSSSSSTAGSSSGSGYVTPQYYGSNGGASSGGSSGAGGGGGGTYTTPVIIQPGGGGSGGGSSSSDPNGSGWVTPQYTGSGN